MFNFVNLLATNGAMEFYEAYAGISFALIVIMAVAALAAIVLVLLQPSNSSGIDALGGSSETFFGKNKGKAIEERLKKWTWICLGVLAVLSIIFFLLPVIFA